MRKISRLAYLLFQAILAVGCTVYFRDFSVVTMLLSILFAVPLYERLHKEHIYQWLVPCGFAVALALGGFYYLTDLWVFSHSARAAYRLHDACGLGIVWSLGSLLMAWGTSGMQKAAVSPP